MEECEAGLVLQVKAIHLAVFDKQSDESLYPGRKDGVENWGVKLANAGMH